MERLSTLGYRFSNRLSYWNDSNAGACLCGLRTLKLFKGNVAGRAWTYISTSAVFFSVGVVMFLIDALAPMGLVAAGGIMQTVGAFLLFLGLRENYLFWASKDHFA